MVKLAYEDLIRNPSLNEFLIDKISEEGLILIKLLFNKSKYISEFVLADKSGIYVNTVRSLLYKLYEYKVVSYNRKKEKARGWYIYSWKFHPERLFEVVINQKKKEIKALETKKEELPKDQYFICPKCDIKLSFSEAMENNFTCTSCFDTLEASDSKSDERKIKRKISEIKNDIESIKNLIPKPKKKK